MIHLVLYLDWNPNVIETFTPSRKLKKRNCCSIVATPHNWHARAMQSKRANLMLFYVIPSSPASKILLVHYLKTFIEHWTHTPIPYFFIESYIMEVFLLCPNSVGLPIIRCNLTWPKIVQNKQKPTLYLIFHLFLKRGVLCSTRHFEGNCHFVY